MLCTRSPDNKRACHYCNVLEKKTAKIFAGHGDENGREVEIKVDVLFCHKRNCYIYPPSVGVKGNAYDMGDIENIEMPHKCELREFY